MTSNRFSSLCYASVPKMNLSELDAASWTSSRRATVSALMLDCRSLEYRLLPMPDNLALVICNTKMKHELAGSEYHLRRTECGEVVRRLAAVLPHVRALRDLNSRELEQHRGRLTPTLYKRARHVVNENERVKSAAAALEQGDIGEFGELMRASHRSLRDD